MTFQLRDKTGARVTIRIDGTPPTSAYGAYLADGTPVGRADFIDSPVTDGERIFFHTEVAQQHSGRGLGGLLVREALADSIRKNLTVVPVCPLFAAHLQRYGDEFIADGGRFRRATRADIDLVEGSMKVAV